MTAADIKLKAYEWIHLPNMEVVELTVSDGETYTSVKFKKIRGAMITRSEDNDGYTNVTFDGQTATIHTTGTSDTNMTLVLFGEK